MLNILQNRPVGPSCVPDRSGFSSLVSGHASSSAQWHACLGLSLSFVWFSDIVSPFCYESFASALHRYGVCFASNEIDSFANELSTRQIEKKPSCKALEIQDFSKNKNIC